MPYSTDSIDSTTATGPGAPDSTLNWKAEYEAPIGQIWVCGACGKSNRNRVDVGDTSCFSNAVLCYEEHGLGDWKAVPTCAD